MIILGIETSCDETAAAVIEGRKAGTQNFVFIKSNIVSSQINIHRKYGGVVPEVAAREHVLQILPVINEALERAGIPSPLTPLPLRSLRERGNKKRYIKIAPSLCDNRRGREVGGEGLDAIAVTVGPGLITSLLVGVETAKTLSYVWQIPIVAINHIEGHIYANFIENQKIQFPAVILTVSGGHTMLVLMKGHGKYKTIGETRDDAAGEAFDKAAKLLGLGYPGGPSIAAEAEKYIKQNSKISNKIKLPRPMINTKNFDFSFSGLKTALLYKLKKGKNWKNKIPEYAYEFQQAIIDVLIHKTIRAAQEYRAKTIMLTGGVAANQELRKQMTKKIKEQIPDLQFLIPNLKYTTDNAVMIAGAGYYRALRKGFIPWQKLRADCNLELK